MNNTARDALREQASRLEAEIAEADEMLEQFRASVASWTNRREELAYMRDQINEALR